MLAFFRVYRGKEIFVWFSPDIDLPFKFWGNYSRSNEGKVESREWSRGTKLMVLLWSFAEKAVTLRASPEKVGDFLTEFRFWKTIDFTHFSDQEREWFSPRQRGNLLNSRRFFGERYKHCLYRHFRGFLYHISNHESMWKVEVRKASWHGEWERGGRIQARPNWRVYFFPGRCRTFWRKNQTVRDYLEKVI
jgi:hypothetical protein